MPTPPPWPRPSKRESGLIEPDRPARWRGAGIGPCLEFAPAGRRCHARSIAIMPTLDDAFPAVCAALVEHFGRPAADFEGLAPFEAMVAVLLDRDAGRRALAGRARRPRRGGSADARIDWPRPSSSRSAMPCARRASRRRPSTLAPLKHLARWLVDHHGGRVDSLFDPHRSTDWLRGELAAHQGHRRRRRRRDPPLRPEAAVLSRRSRHVPGPGSPRLARSDGDLRRGPRPAG